jgi:hypothetical protein
MRLAGDEDTWRRALREGDISMIRQLLKQGEDVNLIHEVTMRRSAMDHDTVLASCRMDSLLFTMRV